MRRLALPVLLSFGWLTGCGMGVVATPTSQSVSSVTPSATGIPNSVATLGQYEYISVQGTGQIFIYNLSSGQQVQLGTPYSTPCADPSGMGFSTVGAITVMSVVCYDTSSLLTLWAHPDGSLTPLGSVAGLTTPYPGMAVDGTNVYIPLFGISQISNGAVAKVSIASPTTPVLIAITPLASPVSGGFANPGYLAVSAGNVFVSAGSESGPQTSSSTIQVINEATMSLVGTPFVVAHSPQKLAVQNGTAYVALYDAAQLESIDVSDPANLKLQQIVSLNSPGQQCNPIPVLARGNAAYLGCYAQGVVQSYDITDPKSIKLSGSVSGIPNAQSMSLTNDSLLVTNSTPGGAVYDLPVAGGSSGRVGP